MGSLWKSKNYLMPVPYLIAHHIYEYDIQKANISVLRELNLIDEDYYQRLYKLPRMQRQVEIGYLIKYTDGLSDKLSEGIASFRKSFFEANNIEDEDILSIKNDAILVIDKITNVLEFGKVKFIKKNSYTTFIKLNNIEIYFEYNTIDGTASLDIKGISDSKLELHHEYIASVIADIIYYIESGDVESGLTFFSDFYNKYIEKQLPYGYYRNFNSDSDYTISANGTLYSIPNCNNDNTFRALDISVNLNILRELYGYLTNIYFSKIK